MDRVNMSTIIRKPCNQTVTKMKCAICLQSLPTFSSSQTGKKQRYFFKICCETLKIDCESMKNQNMIKFCYNCQLIMKDLNKLLNKLTSIQNSIRKIETDIKAKILNCYEQKTNQCWTIKNEHTDRNAKERQQFRYMAVKDFLPVISVSKIDNQHHNLSQVELLPKSTANQIYPSQDYIPNENIIAKIEPDTESNIDMIKQETSSQYIGLSFTGNGDEFYLSSNIMEDSFQLKALSSDLIKKPINDESPLQSRVDEIIVPDIYPVVPSNSDTKRAQVDSNSNYSDDEDFSGLEVGDTQDSDSDFTPEPKRSKKATGNNLTSTSDEGKAQDLPTVNENDASVKIPKTVIKNRKRLKSQSADKRDYLRGAETKIEEGKWSYRSIVYYFDADTSLYICSVCQKTRMTQAKLRAHIRNNHGVEGYGRWSFMGVPYSFNKDADKFECSVCNKYFVERCSLVRHIRDYHKEMCSSRTKYVKRVEQADGDADHPNNEESSALEVGDTHDSDSDYKPERKRRKGIGKKSPSTSRQASKAKKNTKDLLKVNENETTNNPTPLNEKIQQRFKNIQNKRDYLQGAETKITDGKWCYRSIVYHFDATTSLYVCSACQKTRKTQAKLRAHIGNNHGVDGYGKWSFAGVPYSFNKEAEKFVCSVCEKLFVERSSLVRHIREYHREKCKTVLKKVYFEDKLKQKQSEKAENKSKSELFSVPPVLLEEGKWLYREVEIRKQSSDGYFICGACERLRKGFHSMLMHVLECHDEKARSENACKICGRQFGTSYRLKSHMEMHSEQKHICEQCGESFKFKGSLRDHISRVHEQRRPYVCEYCAKAFYTRKDCRVHVRTHTKEKPYICEYPGCGMAFSLSATLKNHMNSKVHQY